MIKVLYSPADPKCNRMQANGYLIPQEFDNAIPVLEDLVKAGILKREERKTTAKEDELEILDWGAQQIKNDRDEALVQLVNEVKIEDLPVIDESTPIQDEVLEIVELAIQEIKNDSDNNVTFHQEESGSNDNNHSRKKRRK